MIQVWGIAAGRGTTKEAAPGALTTRDYESIESLPRRDWREIISIGRVEPTGVTYTKALNDQAKGPAY